MSDGNLIEAPQALWEVQSQMVDKTKNKNAGTVMVRVSKLLYGNTVIQTVEGQLAYEGLLQLAADYNRRGVLPTRHRRAFADIPTEGARAKESLKKQTDFAGPGFESPT